MSAAAPSDPTHRFLDDIADGDRLSPNSLSKTAEPSRMKISFTQP